MAKRELSIFLSYVVKIIKFPLNFNRFNLSSILNYINQLQEVNTDNVEPLAHALDVSNVFREDVLKESLNVNEALANAPDRQGNFYGVPAIFE